jgi:hypothetical protein
MGGHDVILVVHVGVISQCGFINLQFAEKNSEQTHQELGLVTRVMISKFGSEPL